VMVAPIIPGLTDHEVPAILAAAAEAGASSAGYIVLRLPRAVAPLMEKWLDQHYPARKDKVLNRVRDMRGGHINDARFGSRMRGEGIFAQQVAVLFKVSCRQAGIPDEHAPLSTDAFRVPGADQMSLFA